MANRFDDGTNCALAAIAAQTMALIRPNDAVSMSIAIQGDEHFVVHLYSPEREDSPARSAYQGGATPQEACAAALAVWRQSEARPSCLTIVQDGPDAE